MDLGSLSDMFEGYIGCFRHEVGFTSGTDWMLMAKLTPELINAYAYTHKPPLDHHKYNTEPELVDVVTCSLKNYRQTPRNLKRIYKFSDKRPSRTKIAEYTLLFAFDAS